MSLDLRFTTFFSLGNLETFSALESVDFPDFEDCFCWYNEDFMTSTEVYFFLSGASDDGFLAGG